jgi:hypothetical protein
MAFTAGGAAALGVHTTPGPRGPRLQRASTLAARCPRRRRSPCLALRRHPRLCRRAKPSESSAASPAAAARSAAVEHQRSKPLLPRLRDADPHARRWSPSPERRPCVKVQPSRPRSAAADSGRVLSSLPSVSSPRRSPRSHLHPAHLARDPRSPEHQRQRPPGPPEVPCSLTGLYRGRRKVFLQKAPCKIQ